MKAVIKSINVPNFPSVDNLSNMYIKNKLKSNHTRHLHFTSDVYSFITRQLQILPANCKQYTL